MVRGRPRQLANSNQHAAEVCGAAAAAAGAASVASFAILSETLSIVCAAAEAYRRVAQRQKALREHERQAAARAARMALTAAEAAKQPHPTTAPQAKSYSPAPDADRGGAAFETEAAGGADRAPSQGSVLQGEVEQDVTGGRLEPVPAAGRDLTAERPAPGRGAGVAECGVGIGVGAAAHGTWKIKRVVAGGSVDRAVGGGSATRPLQEGDILTRVDGSSLSGMSIADLSSLVKGPHGSRVVLEFYSALDSSLHTLTVDRVCE